MSNNSWEEPDQIIFIDDYVHRPVAPWTEKIHKLLHFIRNEGFVAAPMPMGFDKKGREIVSFIQGEVSNYPLSSNAKSVSTLVSAAKLLRKYHDTTLNFLNSEEFEENCWQLPVRYPKEVICHSDFAPYNVVLEGEEAIGIIDFDTCHPGPRVWDIAYALYRWAPLTNPNNPDGFGRLEDQIQRARLFCQSYGLPMQNRKGMPSLIIERLQALVNFLFIKAADGNKKFEANIRDNHHLLYINDIDYIKSNSILIEKGLLQ